MPDFRLREDCRRWFGHISKRTPFSTLFDSYYLCFLLGVAARHTSNPSKGAEAHAFVATFPRPYDQQQRLLIGLMIDAELVRLGIEPTDRASVNRIVNEIAGPGGLTSQGAARMNNYASGGFDLLIEEYREDEPRTAAEFLPRYLRILDAASGMRLSV